MDKTAIMIFDGEVLRPESPLDLEPQARYEVVIREAPSPVPGGETAWDVLDQMGGTLEGPGDWAAEHDHYLYGTPKRQDETPR